jgi:hypothetical protein
VAVQGYQDRPWAELLSLWQMPNLRFAQTVQRVNKAHLSRSDKKDYRFILLGLEGVTGRRQWIRTPWR